MGVGNVPRLCVEGKREEKEEKKEGWRCWERE